MNYVPIGGRVCILPEKRKEKTEGGLIIPDKAQKDEGRGIIQSVSGDIENPQIKAGDKVIYNLGRVFALEQEGVLYHVVNYEEVYAVLPQ
jgi:chaperonin GroES